MCIRARRSSASISAIKRPCRERAEGSNNALSPSAETSRVSSSASSRSSLRCASSALASSAKMPSSFSQSVLARFWCSSLQAAASLRVAVAVSRSCATSCDSSCTRYSSNRTRSRTRASTASGVSCDKLASTKSRNCCATSELPNHVQNASDLSSLSCRPPNAASAASRSAPASPVQAGRSANRPRTRAAVEIMSATSGNRKAPFWLKSKQ
mmetsp:Transcript_103617/g.288466  ORF Transcript_103617/g.288466 Transcript_103617/m.288466 type:complete len:211 (-) Transcript_103617:87-719(-)